MYGPCSACGDGDTALKYHNHEPSPRSYVVYGIHDIELLAQQWCDSTDNRHTRSDALQRRLTLSVFIEWLAKREQGKERANGLRSVSEDQH